MGLNTSGIYKVVHDLPHDICLVILGYADVIHSEGIDWLGNDSESERLRDIGDEFLDCVATRCAVSPWWVKKI